MKLKDEKINKDKYYSVGYCQNLDKYLLSIVIPSISWYNRYYEITKEEFQSYGTEALDDIVLTCRKQMTESKRFLFSDMMDENNKTQLEQYRIATERTP